VTEDRVVFRSRLFEVIDFPAPEEHRSALRYERVRRAPGVRILLFDGTEDFLLSSEKRFEFGGDDLRLPGGKVFDETSADEPFWLLSMKDKVSVAEEAARKELREELGVETGQLELLEVVPCGSTIEWDLYYFIGHSWSLLNEGPAKEAGEESIEPVVLSVSALWDAVHTGQVAEGRSALVISKYLYPNVSTRGGP
jgi:8-oxo-dGTP pyrophosphatase MutT (NUDIX family)